MEVKNSLASGIDITKKTLPYDTSCKHILAEKSILANIMHSCLREFKDLPINTIAEKCIQGHPSISEVPVAPDETGSFLQGLNQAQISPAEGSVFFDIYFNAGVPSGDDNVQLIVNIESQNDYYPGYPLVKRGVYYCARILSAQKGTVFTGSHYGQLRKVYSVWICTRPPKHLRNTIKIYHMTEDDIIGHSSDKINNYDLLAVIMVCLGDPDDKNCKGILRLLGILLSAAINPEDKKQILHDEFNIPITTNIETEINQMCNLGEAIYRDGLAKGEAQGKTRGIKLGIEQNIIASIQSLMATLKLSAQEAMNALRIPESEQAKYLEKIAH
ncbi:MAG: hypothetical protein Q4F00_13520 [bacterium]|nr:hypothetical protein [bacterium]